MGCLCSKDAASDGKVAAATGRPKLRYVVLGPQFSGKTTLIKHIQLVYGQLANRAAMLTLVPFVSNAVTAQLIAIAQSVIDYSTTHPDSLNPAIVDRCLLLKEKLVLTGVTGEVYMFLLSMYQDQTFVETLSNMYLSLTKPLLNKADFHYLLDASRRVLDPNYEPTTMDVLRLHWPTSGAHCVAVETDSVLLEFTDVGGSINERKKWKQVIRENFNASIIFVVSLDCFTVVDESTTENQMTDTLNLFRYVCSEYPIPSSSPIPSSAIQSPLPSPRSPRTPSRKHVPHRPPPASSLPPPRLHERTTTQSVSLSVSSASNIPLSSPNAATRGDRRGDSSSAVINYPPVAANQAAEIGSEVLLVFNKLDVFDRAVKEHGDLFRQVFPEYTSKEFDPESALEVVKNAFIHAANGRRVAVVCLSALQGYGSDGSYAPPPPPPAPSLIALPKPNPPPRASTGSTSSTPSSAQVAAATHLITAAVNTANNNAARMEVVPEALESGDSIKVTVVDPGSAPSTSSIVADDGARLLEEKKEAQSPADNAGSFGSSDGDGIRLSTLTRPSSADTRSQPSSSIEVPTNMPQRSSAPPALSTVVDGPAYHVPSPLFSPLQRFIDPTFVPGRLDKSVSSSNLNSNIARPRPDEKVNVVPLPKYSMQSSESAHNLHARSASTSSLIMANQTERLISSSTSANSLSGPMLSRPNSGSSAVPIPLPLAVPRPTGSGPGTPTGGNASPGRSPSASGSPRTPVRTLATATPVPAAV